MERTPSDRIGYRLSRNSLVAKFPEDSVWKKERKKERKNDSLVKLGTNREIEIWN